MSAKLNIIIDDVMYRKALYKVELIHNDYRPLFFVDGYKGKGGHLKVLGKKLEGKFKKCGEINGMSVLIGMLGVKLNG